MIDLQTIDAVELAVVTGGDFSLGGLGSSLFGGLGSSLFGGFLNSFLSMGAQSMQGGGSPTGGTQGAQGGSSVPSAGVPGMPGGAGIPSFFTNALRGGISSFAQSFIGQLFPTQSK
jgi:hypothetical protein